MQVVLSEPRLRNRVCRFGGKFSHRAVSPHHYYRDVRLRLSRDGHDQLQEMP